MDKRVNSILFILAATVVNIVLMIVLFLVAFLVFARFLAPHLPPGVSRALLLVLFIGSIVGTFLIYHRLMKWATRKYEMEKYFAPLFGRKDTHRRGE
jgi:membrane protein YdbS with pleckstrin-like domain